MADLLVATFDGADFYFPEAYVTDTGAILAKRGTGKSNAGVVIAEEMHAAGHQWVAIDPGGDWWGIRSDGPGGPGLPVLILGGLHGDLPLLPTAGALVAELIVEQGISCVVDVSDFDTKTDQVRFLTDFGARLFDLQRRNPSPIHVIVEEAQEVLPQMVGKDMTRCVGVWTKLVKIGRKHGIGITLITQRSAALNNNALTQIDTLIALRTPAAADKKAIKGWVEGATDTATWKDVEATLSKLPNGDAWVVSPHFLDFTGRVTFRRRHTFDSGATPELGEARVAPELASIDLSGIEAAMAEVAEQAAADDPAALRKEIARLKAELAAGPAPAAPALDASAVRALESVAAGLRDLPALTAQAISDGVANTLDRHYGVAEGLGRQIEDIVARAADAVPTATASPATRPAARRPAAAAAKTTASTPRTPAPAAALTNAPDKVLNVIAQHPDGCSKTKLALMSGYAPGKSTIRNALSRLRGQGYITDGAGGTLHITDAGRAAAGDPVPFPVGRELIDFWLGELGGAPAICLKVLVDADGAAVTDQDIADASNGTLTAGTSTIRNAMSKLRGLDLARGWAVNPELLS